MRIVLFTNSDRGMEILKALRRRSETHIVHVVDDNTDVNSEEFLSIMKSWKPDLFIVAGFPQIFRKPLLDIPGQCWNCHAGPLPQYRGGSPLNWQIINGLSVLGVSLMIMDEGIDTGPVIEVRKFILRQEETIKEAHAKANKLFASMVLDALERFPPKAVQRVGEKRYWKQRSDEDGEIDFTKSAAEIYDFVRALTHPYPGAWIRCDDGRKLRIWSASVD